MRVCEGCLVVEKTCCIFSGTTTYFAISMPSCGCCDCNTYDNASMVRGVEVLCQKLEGRKADMRVCEGCLVVKSLIADFLAPLPTLLQVCRLVAAVTVIHTTMLAS